MSCPALAFFVSYDAPNSSGVAVGIAAELFASEIVAAASPTVAAMAASLGFLLGEVHIVAQAIVGQAVIH